MKKLMTTTAMAVVLTAASFAVAKKPVAKEGVYVGVDLGYAHLNANGKAYHTGPDLTQKQKSASGMKADLIVGYEAPVADEAMLLGGELLASLNGAQTKTNQTIAANDETMIKIKSKYAFGANVLLGAPFSECLAGYLKLGVMYSKFQFKNTNSNPGLAGYASASQNKSAWGFAPGVRLRWAATEDVSVYGDVTYVLYQSIKTKDFTPSNTNDTYRVKCSPRELSITVGVSYKF